MKLLAIYDTWNKPIKSVDFGIEYAYLVRANHAYTASDETEIPSMDGADCVARITDRLEAAGFRDVWEIIEVNAKLLDVLKKVEVACKATGNYIGQNGQLIKEVRAAIAKAEPEP
jgi:hypothetical protein